MNHFATLESAITCAVLEKIHLVDTTELSSDVTNSFAGRSKDQSILQTAGFPKPSWFFGNSSSKNSTKAAESAKLRDTYPPGSIRWQLEDAKRKIWAGETKSFL